MRARVSSESESEMLKFLIFSWLNYRSDTLITSMGVQSMSLMMPSLIKTWMQLLQMNIFILFEIELEVEISEFKLEGSVGK
jgi:hypothetical protein